MKVSFAAGYKLILTGLISLILFPLTSLGWWNTGHSVAAALAEKRLSDKTRKAVNALLARQINLPGQVKCYSSSNNYMTATASWMDEIKKGWWTSGKAKSFYSAAHYIDIPVDLNNPPAPASIRSLLEKEIIATDGDNVLTTLRAAVKSLAGDTTQEEKAFALRLIIHNIADMTCPMHLCDIRSGSNVPTTRGGNWVYINSPEQISIIDGNSQSATNLHAFWDAMANANQQVPYADSCDLTTQDEAFIAKMVSTLNSKFAGLDKEVSATADVMEWCEDSATAAVTSAADPAIFQNSYVSNNHIYIDRLTQSYLEKAKNVAQTQVYKAGVRLANLLNAIYDPESASSAYVDYIQSLLKDKNVKHLFEIKEVDVKFY
ncbi:S1/P1 nuclease [Lentisphaerota bacterium ZTH]|nr:S1/P1 nuclease [Lentisphaerota bacterium]WET06738.1 S1/P1 nuclease [Lentisphaerota bacterium ZTH]